MARRSGTVMGPLLIVVGLLMLLPQVGFPGIGFLWPMLVLAVGVGLLLRYFQTHDDSGFAFTGALLVLLGAFFQLYRWFDFPMGDHWPFFVLAPGLAMLTMATLDRHRRDALVPAGVLIGLSLIFYLFASGFFHQLFRGLVALLRFIVRIGVPVGLIALGAWLLFGRRRGLGQENLGFPEKVEPKGAADWAPVTTVAAAVDETPETLEPDELQAEEHDVGPDESEVEEPRVDDTEPLDRDVPEADEDEERK
jgi:hypothetical protein